MNWFQYLVAEGSGSTRILTTFLPLDVNQKNILKNILKCAIPKNMRENHNPGENKQKHPLDMCYPSKRLYHALSKLYDVSSWAEWYPLVICYIAIENGDL